MKIAFIHGRPGPHPFHATLAQAVGADFHFVDRFLPWHGDEKPGPKRYLSWIINALKFPASKYDIILSEGLHFTPVLIKFFHPFSQTRIICLLANEQPYFTYIKKYSFLTVKVNILALKLFDAIIGCSEMVEALVKSLTGRSEGVYSFFNGVSRKRLNSLQNLQPDYQSKNIVFIGNGPGGWRAWYKGMDLLVQSFVKARETDSTLKLTIAGDWNQEYISDILKGLDEANRQSVRFIGKVEHLEQVLESAGLYLHPARGEAFGISILEAMAAGVVPIVTEWTGAREAVEKVSEGLVVPLDPDLIEAKIKWYFSLSFNTRAELGIKARNVASEYSEEEAVPNFKKLFYKVINQLI